MIVYAISNSIMYYVYALPARKPPPDAMTEI